MIKTAVVLFNLGGPDRPEAVRPFLNNLFRDPAILRLPPPFRQMLAWIIARKRAKTAQTIYAHIGGKSPLLENTKAQAKALEGALVSSGDFKCFVSMRYWHPFSKEALVEIEAFKPDQIVLLPLYPQFSTTTTASSFHDFWKAVQENDGEIYKNWERLKVKAICCYPEEPGFIQALSKATKQAYDQATRYGKPRVLFSAHGLPEKIIHAGDPYAEHCELTAAALVKNLNIPQLDWGLCYQSRLGPLTWIGPATDQEIQKAALDKRPIIVVPLAFVSEHSETLVELDIEYKKIAEDKGSPYYIRVPAVGTTSAFIEGLAQLVHSALQTDQDCISGASKRVCGEGMCCWQQKANAA